MVYRNERRASHRKLEAAQAEDAGNRNDVFAGLRASVAQVWGKIERVAAAITTRGHSETLSEKLA